MVISDFSENFSFDDANLPQIDNGIGKNISKRTKTNSLRVKDKIERIVGEKGDVLKRIELKSKSNKFVDAFFEEGQIETEIKAFQELNLSRPLMKAINVLNYAEPTPIQATAIPVAMKGRDICACAATGTGKTAAFMLPVLERLSYKPKNMANITRVLVLVPTRELGIQVYQVSRQLAQFTNVTISLSVGGFDVKNQELALRNRPDIVIATPGRLIDHLQNAPSFDLQNIEILILDEADRMLDTFFAEQMKEIIKQCSYTRQTMLFSATMTDQVKDLAGISLKNPVKLFVDSNTQVAKNLRQEFVRIRDQREGDREAILASLLTRTFKYGVIVFVQTKLQTHRLAVQLKLLGLKAGELHGNLNQTERMDSLKKFKEGETNVLLCTDLASRGLDIEGIRTVLNFTLPNSYKHYIHRVGRTARAGNKGRAVSLVGDQERSVFREVLKNSTHSSAVYRKVTPDVISSYRYELEKLEARVQENLRDEKYDKELNVTQLRVYKAEKMIKHHDEIMARPKRTWFQSHGQRMKEQKDLKLDPNFKENAAKKKMKEAKRNKKAKVSSEDLVNYEIKKAREYALKCLNLTTNTSSAKIDTITKMDKNGKGKPAKITKGNNSRHRSTLSKPGLKKKTKTA